MGATGSVLVVRFVTGLVPAPVPASVPVPTSATLLVRGSVLHRGGERVAGDGCHRADCSGRERDDVRAPDGGDLYDGRACDICGM